MDTISILLRIVIKNINFLIPLILLYLLIGFVGFAFFISLVKKKNWMLSISGGMILGQMGLIIFLGILSHFLRGAVGISVIFTLFILSGIYVFIKNRKNLPKVENAFRLNNLIIAIVSAIILFFLMFLVGTNEYGGDVLAYWGFATSFSRGNYPIHSPWQPDLLSVHHKGTYMVEGLINALTNTNISLIHTLQSYFVIAAGIFFLWGLVRELINRDFLSIIPALFAYFSFGAFFVPIPNFLTKFINPEVERVTSRLPLFVDAKIRLGGASVLPDLIYINHRATAMAGLFLIIGLIVLGLKISNKLKPVLVAVLSIAVISSDESLLPALAAIAIGWCTYLLIKPAENTKKETAKNFIFAGIAFALLFLVVDNALRDSLFVPSNELSRFRVVYQRKDIVTRLHEMRGVILRINENDPYFWYLPSLRLLVVFGLALAVFDTSLLSLITIFAIIGVFAATMFLDHALYAQNYSRFLHQIYFYTGFIISYNLLTLLKFTKRMMFNNLPEAVTKFLWEYKIYLKCFSVVFLTFVVTLSILFSFKHLYGLAKKPDYPNFYGSRPLTSVLNWMDGKVSKERVFFVDGYLRGYLHSPYNEQAIQNFGFFVPVSPADIKVHTPDFGIEAFDIIMTLNPTPMKKLKLDLIYVSDDQLEFYPQKRIDELQSDELFEVIYKDDYGKLYRIKKEYFAYAADLSGGLSEIATIIDLNSKVYVDHPPNIVMAYRAAILLVLKDYPQVYTHWASGAFNAIETEIKTYTPNSSLNYDYLILANSTDPYSVCNCKSVDSVWDSTGLKLYKTSAYQN